MCVCVCLCVFVCVCVTSCADVLPVVLLPWSSTHPVRTCCLLWSSTLPLRTCCLLFFSVARRHLPGTPSPVDLPFPCGPPSPGPPSPGPPLPSAGPPSAGPPLRRTQAAAVSQNAKRTLCEIHGHGIEQGAQFNEKTPERKKGRNLGGKGKKREMLGSPPFGPHPTLRASTLRTPPLFPGVGPHSLGPPPLWGPSPSAPPPLCPRLWAPTLRAQKQIGLSRNWPKQNTPAVRHAAGSESVGGGGRRPRRRCSTMQGGRCVLSYMVRT